MTVQRGGRSTLEASSRHPSPEPALPIQSIKVLSVHQVTVEWLDDGTHIPLRPVFIMQKILDAVPLRRAVVVATVPLVEKLTMLLAYIFVVSTAIFDLHLPLPLAKYDSF
jgi:hypothetical protein